MQSAAARERVEATCNDAGAFPSEAVKIQEHRPALDQVPNRLLGGLDKVEGVAAS